MKLRYPLSSVALCLGLAFSASAADTYTLDPAHSTVGFAVTHLVINTVKGKFTEFTGSVVLDNGNLVEAKGVIDTRSIDTGIQKRDEDLRSANFFDVTKYSKITFQTKRVEKKGKDYEAIGDFTMHGVTKQITLPVVVKGPIKDPWGGTRVGLQARTMINRKDYGLTYNKVLEAGGVMISDEVEIEINAEAVKAAAK